MATITVILTLWLLTLLSILKYGNAHDQNHNSSLLRNERNMYSGDRLDGYRNTDNRDYGDNNYYGDYRQCPRCEKCEECDEVTSTNPAPQPDPTVYNPCLRPSLPARCTAEECQATLDSGMTAAIYPRISRFNVSRCAFAFAYTFIGRLDVCVVPGLDEDLNEVELQCAPNDSPFSDCIASDVALEITFGGGGLIYVGNPSGTCTVTKIDQPVLLTCQYLLISRSESVNMASAIFEVQILPDPAPCDNLNSNPSTLTTD